MTSSSLGRPEQLCDPNYTPPLAQAIPLGIQHVLAMFVSNVTPAIIVAGAAGIGFGSDQGALSCPDMSYMIQLAMLFAGVATLIQTIDIGPVGARLPIVQGTSFAFIFATALSVGLGLHLVPEALQHLGKTAQVLLTSGLLPSAAIAIVLNLALPEDLDGSIQRTCSS